MDDGKERVMVVFGKSLADALLQNRSLLRQLCFVLSTVLLLNRRLQMSMQPGTIPLGVISSPVPELDHNLGDLDGFVATRR